MKFRVLFKDDAAFNEAISAEDDELDMDLIGREDIVSKFFDGDQLVIEFDTVDLTARVVPVDED